MTDHLGRAALVGDSRVMCDLRAMIDRVARTRLSVLVHGETGSGKELVAQALHRSSRQSGAIVAVNVCAVGESMFEASLFGHVRGAFTGAVGNSPGFLAEANGGTLFLDEISGLPVAAQAKLLRAVETKEFRPVGARADRRSDFRVVAATNEELTTLVAAGRFRADLFQRLAGVSVRVPPLRSRVDDLPMLVAHFARGCADATRPVHLTRFSDRAMHRLQSYDWPGNVRELRNVVERVIALSESPHIGQADIDLVLDASPCMTPARERAGRLQGELLAALKESGWDVDEVARRLGVHRATIYRRLKRVPSSQVVAMPTLSSSSLPRVRLEA